MKNIFLCLLLLLVVSSCDNQHNHTNKRHKHSLLVKKYQVVNPNGKNTETTDDDFLFWYVITSSNQNYRNEYYVYGSNVPVTNFSTVSWGRTTTLPREVEKEIQDNKQEPEEQEVAIEEMSPEFQQEIDLNAEYFEGMTSDELGNYETSVDDGGSSTMNSNAKSENEDEVDSNNESEGETDSSNDSGSSDSGSGDSGSSDGGGGE